MKSRAIIALGIVLVSGILIALWRVWEASLEPMRATLLVTIVIAIVTTFYSLITLGIMVQNTEMVKATKESAKVMEQSLRFSYASSLAFSTVVTKDPRCPRKQCVVFRNDQYETVVREYTGTGTQAEFVFALLRNVGRGAATQVSLQAVYDVKDTAYPNKDFAVKPNLALQSLDSGSAVAVLVYISKTPTPDDKVQLVQASILRSDFYRDAFKEDPIFSQVKSDRHEIDRDEGCLLQVK